MRFHSNAETVKPALQVAHVTSWLSPQGGGIPPVIRGLVRENMRSGVDCLVAGLRDEFMEPEGPVPGVKAILGHAIGPLSFGFSPELKCRLAAEASEGLIIHSHGLWMHPGVVARELAKSSGFPLVVSPHGMLEPWALVNSRWKKRFAALLFENRNLRSADCLHALCEAEARNMRQYGLRNPIAVIPNGVDWTDFSPLPPYEAMEVEHTLLQGKRRMLFLSRIHPKKGLPHLLRAWRRVVPEFNDWILLIVGSDQLGHEQEMRSLAVELGLGNAVAFLGPLYGENKKRAMAGADAFVLPSFSEGFSMAILEAAACGLPVMMTPQCNFPELTAAGGAIEMQPEMASCENGLRQMLSLSNAQRKGMGSCGQGLIQESYTWAAIAARMAAVYAWVLQQGPKPECVSLN
jgi:poly(glycerol-phosphate) alpha-glucosyltransferase